MLVTADHKFTDKIVDGYPHTNARYIGPDYFTDEISAAAMVTRTQPEGEHE